MNPVIIIGCGEIGRAVAVQEQKKEKRVIGLVQSEESAQKLHDLEIEVLRGDLDQPDSLGELPFQDSLMYYFAPPPSQGKSDPRIESFLQKIAFPFLPRKVVLISTSGVYGDSEGTWISEDTPVNPGNDRSNRRLAAENALLRWGKRTQVAVIILRVPGIYGPGRLPEKRIQQGEPVLREEEAPFSNRIHAEDLAQACLRASLRGQSGEIYNITDGNPTTMTDYFFRVADFLELPRPPSITRQEAQEKLSPGMLSYLSESRRIKNDKMIRELGVDLLYPNLEKGLKACIE